MKIINTDTHNVMNPYAQAVDAGKIVFISGQIGICPDYKSIPNNIVIQTQQSLENIKLILQKINLNINNIAKTTVYITNIKNIHQVNITYKKFFIKNNAQFPARSCIEVSKLPHNAQIEIEAIAVKP